jgi:protein required for attachment to host cells
MKPTITWIVLANARTARIVTHQGPGNGLTALAGKTWQAAEASVPRDRAGVGHSSAGPGVAAVEQSDAKLVNDRRFAKEIIAQIAKDYLVKRFNRLILVSGPHMMGLLRAEIDGPLSAALLGEIPKDLSSQSLDQIETHLGELIAI